VSALAAALLAASLYLSSFRSHELRSHMLKSSHLKALTLVQGWCNVYWYSVLNSKCCCHSNGHFLNMAGAGGVPASSYLRCNSLVVTQWLPKPSTLTSLKKLCPRQVLLRYNLVETVCLPVQRRMKGLWAQEPNSMSNAVRRALPAEELSCCHTTCFWLPRAVNVDFLRESEKFKTPRGLGVGSRSSSLSAE